MINSVVVLGDRKKGGDLTPTAGYLKSVIARFSDRRGPHLSGEGSRNEEAIERNSSIVWLGDYWICNKQLKHYLAFSRDEATITVNSFAWIKGKKGKDHIGYLLDLYETQLGEKMAKVRWFHFQDEVKETAPVLNTHPREVFLTRLEQDIVADCVDGLAAVLTPTHFNKCLGVIKEEMALESVLCHREIRSKKTQPNSFRVKSYNITKLWGYSTQPILSYLICQNSTEEIGKIHISEQPESSKSIASFREDRAPLNVTGNPTTLGARDQAADCEPPRKKLRFRLQSQEDEKVAEPKAQNQASGNTDENIELLSNDSGLQGCWFRCKVLSRKQRRLKVQYYDIYDADEMQKLEEWVPSSAVASPDLLEMRFAGRLTVRPWPRGDSSSSEHVFEVGEAVDAWWADGWWEGVVIGYATPGPDNIQVYFPGENRVLTVERRNIRVSRDWVDNKWVNVKSKPDILSYLISRSHTPRVLPPPPPPQPAPPLTDAVPVSGDGRGLLDLSLGRSISIRHNEETGGSSSRDVIHAGSPAQTRRSN